MSIIEERQFREELSGLLNRYAREQGSNTPDFILARFILDSVKAFDAAANTRDVWYEHHCGPEMRAKIEAKGNDEIEKALIKDLENQK